MGNEHNGTGRPTTPAAAEPAGVVEESGETNMASEPDFDGVPRIFISHRHADKEIADILRNFFLEATAGKVEVFQSSYAGHGPEIGKVLNQELGERLYNAELVFLISTIVDANWSYCMWECGVAFNPRNEDTRIVVLQCGHDVPAPMGDRVRVLLNDENSTKDFVRQFLTEERFFPRLRRPITEFEQESVNVQSWGDRLHSQLQAIITHETDDHWHAWPYLLLELPLPAVDPIKDAYDAGQEDVVHDLVRQHCVVVSSAENATRLFGRARLPQGSALDGLISAWQRTSDEAEPLWVKSLLDQLAAAACSDFPKPEWAAFRHAQNQNLHAPMLFKVLRSPARRCMQFDVYFPWFGVDKSSGAAAVALPK